VQRKDRTGSQLLASWQAERPAREKTMEKLAVAARRKWLERPVPVAVGGARAGGDPRPDGTLGRRGEKWKAKLAA